CGPRRCTGATRAARTARGRDNAGAEFARLVYDSARERYAAGGLRSEAASIRALTLASAHFCLELEVIGDRLLGQLVPPHGTAVEVQSQASASTQIWIDEIGCFLLEPVPATPFRLHWRSEDGAEVVTDWIAL
ncbi:MAG: hypothetical protein ACLPKE_02975, partial [Streptosporangiaceae bacterium]